MNEFYVREMGYTHNHPIESRVTAESPMIAAYQVIKKYNLAQPHFYRDRIMFKQDLSDGLYYVHCFLGVVLASDPDVDPVVFRAWGINDRPGTLLVDQWDHELPGANPAPTTPHDSFDKLWNHEPMPGKHRGADWVAAYYGVTPSKLGTAVANLLGHVYQGIYHLNTTSLGKVDWGCPHRVSVVIPDGGGYVSTVDYDVMTKLVVMCHDYMMRMEVTAAAPGWLRLNFTRRFHRNYEGAMNDYCPTIESHVGLIRKGYGVIK